MNSEQQELPLRDSRKRVRNVQIELPLGDARGAKAQRLIDRFAGKRLHSYWGQIRGMDSTKMVVIASDAGEAKSAYFRRARNGYKVKFTDIKLTRHDIDEWADFLGKGVFSEETVLEIVKKQTQSHQKSSPNDHPEMPMSVRT